MTAEATGGGDEPLCVALEKFPVDARLVVVPLEEREAGELYEVAVSLVVLGEEREVVVLLAPALVRAAVVVHLPAACDALGAVVVGHVGLGADDRLDALLAALLVEVDDPVHVAVVGDAECGLTVLDCLADQFIESGRAVQHGELGVHVEMRE